MNKNMKQLYLKNKIQQMIDIRELDEKYHYFEQFYNPNISFRVGPENYLIAETMIKHLDNPQPDFIQLSVGVIDGSNYNELVNLGRNKIKKQLMDDYPEMYK